MVLSLVATAHTSAVLLTEDLRVRDLSALTFFAHSMYKIIIKF